MQVEAIEKSMLNGSRHDVAMLLLLDIRPIVRVRKIRLPTSTKLKHS